MRMAASTAAVARTRTWSTDASSRPVAAATRPSPSTRVWAGKIALARPSWPLWATSRQADLSSRALVAITPIVVLPNGLGGPGTPKPAAVGASGGIGVDAGDCVSEPAGRAPTGVTSPEALTAIMAATTRPPARQVAAPMPAGRAASGPRHVPTVQPVPAPTRPSCTRPVLASLHAAAPCLAPGRILAWPTPRSERPRVGTIGTGPGGVG